MPILEASYSELQTCPLHKGVFGFKLEYKILERLLCKESNRLFFLLLAVVMTVVQYSS